MNCKKAVILTSGGMDSLITTALAKNENDEIYLLHANYGQRTEEKELNSFKRICQFFEPKDTLIVDIGYLAQIGGNSLTDLGIDIPKNHLTDTVPNTYVPFRNGNLIAIAASWAEVLGASSIYIGAVEVDGSGYPDCRKEFFHQLEKAINLGTKDDTFIQIKTPIIDKMKSEIVKIGSELNIPFELSWSCYENNQIACGECDSCLLRIKAFKQAKLIDPIPYSKIINWSENE